MDPLQLPIRAQAPAIVDAVARHPVTVIIGETGSGKTTQIAQILWDAGLASGGGVAVTQPRRVAAVSVARRVAGERHCEVGGEVGYAVRFEDRTSPATAIKFMTDGTLLREVAADPALSRYAVVVLDEAHERSLNTDILLGLLKGLAAGPRARRGDGAEKGAPAPLTPLKLVVTSATLDAGKVAAFFGGCPVVAVPGRAFPVEVVHSLDDHDADYEAAAVDTALEIHGSQPPGDILVFLAGRAEVERCCAALARAVRAAPPGSLGDLAVLPLYAALPPELQARALAPPPAPGVRRCIVATNVAETSLTVDGVVYVVDAGVAKRKDYCPRSGMESLGVAPISRVSAAQRAGRAGRTRPGRCYRLYTRRRFEREMEDATSPEIQRTSLVSAVLYLKSLPIPGLDVLSFDFLDPPDPGALEDALRQLHVLGALDADGGLTPTGREMAALPVEPCLARAVLAAREGGCLDDMITVAAMLSPEGSVFLGGRGPEALARGGEGEGRGGAQGPGRGPQGRELLGAMLGEGLGDHALLLRVWQGWCAAGQAIEWCREVGVDPRAMRFARDVRRQLAHIVAGAGGDGAGGSGDAAEEGKGGAEGRRGFPGGEGEGAREAKRRRRGGDDRGGAPLAALRRALAIGFAPRLARRLPAHNGYRTLGPAPALAQVHPAAARLATDADGLLPEWVVYHELVATGRVYLSGVCPVEGAWVEDVLPRLHGVDVGRLSGGRAAAAAEGAQGEQARGGGGGGGAAERRNDADAVEAARTRFLARKAAAKAKR